MSEQRPAGSDEAPALPSGTSFNPPAAGLPAAELRYLELVVGALRRCLGQQLLGVYLFGSAAYGDYVPGQSDLDIQAVVREPLVERVRRTVAGALSHQTLPCPARRLEFVCYAQGTISPPSRHPQFELNLNTGADGSNHLSLDPREEPSHWFLLDIAIGRELGLRLFGPPPREIFAEIPRRWQLAAIADSLSWHAAHDLSANTIFNACRGWRYAVTSQWGSKRAGADWASRQPSCPEVVRQALKQPAHTQFSQQTVAPLIRLVQEVVQRELQRAP